MRTKRKKSLNTRGKAGTSSNSKLLRHSKWSLNKKKVRPRKYSLLTNNIAIRALLMLKSNAQPCTDGARSKRVKLSSSLF